jgi:hypothetical protein
MLKPGKLALGQTLEFLAAQNWKMALDRLEAPFT